MTVVNHIESLIILIFQLKIPLIIFQYMSISIDITTKIGHFKKSDLLVVSARHLAFFSAGVKVGLHPRAVGVQILLAFCWLARFGFV